MNSKIIIDFLANTGPLATGAKEVVGHFDKIQLATKRVRQAIFGASAGLGAAFTAAGFKAASFETDMQNVNSIVQDTDTVFARTTTSVLDLATQIPRSANELAKGAYQIVSAGFTSPTQTLDILSASGKAASAGLTTVDTAALAVVTTLNAYGAAAGNATRVSDLLFQTVNVGQVSFEQLAVNLGDFIGIANAAGGTLAETLSAYSSITIATGQASRAATSLQGIYRAFIKPSDAMNASLKSIGASSGKQAIQMYGLQGTIDKLSATVGGSEVGLAKMFQDVEGLNGVLALTGPNAEKARANLTKFTDESQITGATAKALTEQSKAFNYQLDQLKSTGGAIAIEFGQRLLPVMKLAVTIFGAIASQIHSLPGPVKTLLSIVSGLAVVFGTVGLSALLWYSRFNLIRSGIQLLTGTNAIQWLTAMARNSTIAQGALLLLGRATGLTGAQVLGLGKSIGIAVTAFLLAGPALKAFDNAIHPQNIEAMTKALTAWGDAGVNSSTRFATVFGGNTKKLADQIRAFTEPQHNPVAEFLTNIIPPQLDVRTSGAVKKVDELDKAFASLVQSGNIKQAKTLFASVEQALRDQGLSTAQINQAFNDYYSAVGAIDLQNRSAADSSGKFKDATVDAGEAMKKAEDDAKNYADAIQGLQDQAKEWISISKVLTKIEEAHRSTFDQAQKEQQEADRQIQAAKDIAKAQDDMSKAQDKVNRLRYISNNAPLPNTKIYQDLRDAERDVAEAADKIKEAQKGANEEYKKTPASSQEVIDALQGQIAAYNTFQRDLQTAALRGAPIEVIKELQGMGQEGVDMAKLLASAPPEEFDKLKGLLAQKVQIEGEQYQRELDLQLTVAAAIAKRGAAATADNILEEVRKIAPGIIAEIPAIADAMAKLGFTAAAPPPGPPGPTPGAPGDGSPQNYNQMSDAQKAAINAYIGGAPTATPGGVGKWKSGAHHFAKGGRMRPGSWAWLGEEGPELGKMMSGGGMQIFPQRKSANMFNKMTERGSGELIRAAGQMQRAVPTAGQRPTTIAPVTSTKSVRYEFGDIYAQDLTGAMRQADQKVRFQSLAG